MIPIPTRHRRRSHAALIDELEAAARAAFVRTGRISWDPGRRTGDGEIDLGRGLFDSVAVALHVLWTYQQAWAEECFVATARLDTSVDKLLAHVGYQPRPGVAATGVQFLRCRASAPGSVPAGFQLVSPPKGAELEATFETLEPIRVDPLLNEVRAFMPPSTKVAPPAGMGGVEIPSSEDGEPTVPGPVNPFDPGTALSALQDRLDAARSGPLLLRRAARAKAKARNLAKLVTDYDLDADPACKEKLEGMCAQLCEAQQALLDAEAALAGDAGTSVQLGTTELGTAVTGGLSEAQEIIARQLRLLSKRNKDAVAALEGVLARCADEDDASYARRLDQMAAFLDAFVGSLIQEARDQLVLLRGPEVFSRLDQSFGGGGVPERGRASAGSDALYLPPVAVGDEQIDPPVQLGDRLVIGEDVTRIGADGRPITERRFYQAVRIVRLTREVPRGETKEMLRVQFLPALSRSYNLDTAVLLGNVGPISHGKVVVENLTLSADRRTAPLGQAPLTWLRDATAARGRAPEVDLTVGGRPWRRVDDLLAAGANDPVFAVEPAPGGGIRLRFGDGGSGAAIPTAAVITATYRTGVGITGNRAAGRIDGMASSHPSVEAVMNPLATAGGADAEPRASARDLGPTAVGAIDRAISLADVVALTRGYDGVDRARATRDPRRPRRIAVVVSGPGRAALAAADLVALTAYLAVRVPPGLEVVVENRVLVPVHLSLIARYLRGADPIEVVRAIRDRLGADATAETGLLAAPAVELGDDLPVSAIYEATAGVPGLHSLVVRALYRDDEAPQLHGRIVTRPREVLAWAAPAGGDDGVVIAYEEGKDS